MTGAKRVPITRRTVRSAAAALAVVLLASPAPLAAQRSGSDYLRTFSTVVGHVRQNYVDRVSQGELVRAAIAGMLRSLDPHSYYLSQEEWAARVAYERGALAGVGIAIEEVEGTPTVLGVYPDGPAHKKGILPGDRLLSIDDTTVAGLELPALEVKLSGPDGSKVRLTVERGPRLAPDSVSVNLKREFLEPVSVWRYAMADSVTGYVWLTGFTPWSAEELQGAIDRLEDDGAERLILDLRGNPGGVVGASVDVASVFLPESTLVFRSEGRVSDMNESYYTYREGKYTELPLVVIVNEQSASAAEAVAASLQDHDRALVVGRRSFGKALMQSAFGLPGGDVVWLTTARLVSPSGRQIQRSYEGVTSEMYRAAAGRAAAADTTTYPTDAGRRVRGGPGVAPDVELPDPVALPVWWTAAAAEGLVEAVADSVAHELPRNDEARERWLNDTAGWEDALLPPFLERVRRELELDVTPDSETAAEIAYRLAIRVADVRWGSEAAARMFLTHDSDVQAALAEFEGLEGKLGGSVPSGSQQ